MKLKNVLLKLSLGNMSALAVTNQGKGIKEVDYPAFLSLINDFVSDFYVRFHLKYKEVIVRASTDINTYKLHSDFAESNVTSHQPVKYIVDSPDNPFIDDISAIRRVVSTCSKEFNLNDANDPYSVYLIDFDTVQFPLNFFDEGMGFSVMYEAMPPELDLDTAIDLDTEIRLPRFAQNALVAYVEGKYFMKLGGANLPKGVALLNISEQELTKIEREGLLPPKDVQINIGNRLEDWL